MDVKFTIKYEVLEHAKVRATIRLDLPCDRGERGIAVKASDVRLFGEPLGGLWGYYDENGTRYNTTSVEAGTWSDLEQSVRTKIDGVVQQLRQIVENYRTLNATKPDDRTEIYVF